MADRYNDRDERDRYGREHGEFSGRSDDRGYNRDLRRDDRYGREDRYGRDDRGFMDRAGDEVRSWFGDDDAARRREMDERRDRDRSWSDDRSRTLSRDRDDFSGRDRDYDRGRRSFGESQDWNSRWRRDAGSRESYSRGESYGRGDYGTGSESQWRTSGRGRDYGDDDRSWLNRGPNWGREFGWGNERRDYGSHGLFGESSGRFGSTGQHSGRGPKGYQRSDERIREDVCDRLTMSGDVDASNIEVQVNNGEVTLRGSADSRYTRRAAEDIAEAISGVKHVHNEIRVGLTDTTGTGGASGGLNTGASRERVKS